MKISHCGDIHVEEDRYFGDTAQCLESFVEDSIHANTNLFVVDGDLTTYKQTIVSATWSTGSPGGRGCHRGGLNPEG